MRLAALALCLSVLAPPGLALAEDDPSCARYQEPMAYNACLARRGPKAGDLGKHSGDTRPEQAGRDQANGGSRAPGAAFRNWPRAQRVHGRVHMEFRVQ